MKMLRGQAGRLIYRRKIDRGVALALWIEGAGLVLDQDRDTAANGKGQACALADQFLAVAVIVQRLQRDRTDKLFQQFCRWSGAFGIVLIGHVNMSFLPSIQAFAAIMTVHLHQRHQNIGAGHQTACLQQRLLFGAR